MLCLCGCDEEPQLGTDTTPQITSNPSKHTDPTTTDPKPLPTDPTETAPTQPTDPEPTEPPAPTIPTVPGEILLQEPVELTVLTNTDGVPVLSDSLLLNSGCIYDSINMTFYVMDGDELIRRDAAVTQCLVDHDGSFIAASYAWCQYGERIYLWYLSGVSSEGISNVSMVEGSDHLAVVKLYDHPGYLLDVRSGTVQDPVAVLPSEIKDSIYSVLYSPNGSRAWIRYGSKGNKAVFLDCSTGEWHDLQLTSSFVNGQAAFVTDDQLLLAATGSFGGVIVYDHAANVKISYGRKFSDLEHKGIFFNMIRLDADVIRLCDVFTGEQYCIPVEIHAGVSAFRLDDGRWCLEYDGVVYVQNQAGELAPIAILKDE